jgi:hypothetical protein
VGAHQRRRGHLLAGRPERRNVDDDAKIQMPVVEPQHDPTGRPADDRKEADAGPRVRARLVGAPQAEEADEAVAQRQQRADPARPVRKHAPRRLGRIERRTLDFDAIGVGEIRADEQRRGRDFRRKRVNRHDDPLGPATVPVAGFPRPPAPPEQTAGATPAVLDGHSAARFSSRAACAIAASAA